MTIKVTRVNEFMPRPEAEILLYNSALERWCIGLLGKDDRRFYRLDWEKNTRRLPEDWVTHWTYLTWEEV